MIIGGVASQVEEDYFQVSKHPLQTFLFAELFMNPALITIIKMPNSSKNLAL